MTKTECLVECGACGVEINRCLGSSDPYVKVFVHDPTNENDTKAHFCLKCTLAGSVEQLTEDAIGGLLDA